MGTIEQEIIERLLQLGAEEQQAVLDYVKALQEPVLLPPRAHYSPTELLKLPAPIRDKIIAESFRLAQDEDFEIFEAYSEEPLDP